MKNPSELLLLLVSIFMFGSSGCTTTASRDQTADGVIRWSQRVEQQPLQLNLEWAMPMIPGPHPTVIVHPGRGQKASELGEVIDGLAKNGYLAVAVDYLRLINGEYSTTMFPWRDREDGRWALERILDNPLVDRKRVATLGFSMGGAHSLLLAANSPQIKAVVAYYPMTDFPDWVAERAGNPLWRVVFNVMRWNYNAESDLHDDESHKTLLVSYSAINHTDQIQAPVLVIHGDKDGIAPLHHSQRLERALKRSDNTASDLLVIRNVGHAFDLKPSEQTQRSWKATLEWLGRNLGGPARLAMAEQSDQRRRTASTRTATSSTVSPPAAS